MRTPQGGDRSTQWVIQYRMPVVAISEDGVTSPPWSRYPADPSQIPTAAAVRTVLTALRAQQGHLEWRAIRLETVQRVEDW